MLRHGKRRKDNRRIRATGIVPDRPYLHGYRVNTNTVRYIPSALELQNLGFSIREKTCGGKKLISWTSKNHWGQAVYDENSGEDLELVAEKLREGIVSARNEKQRKHGI